MARNICSGFQFPIFSSTNVISEPFEVSRSQLINRGKEELTGQIGRVAIFRESRSPVFSFYMCSWFSTVSPKYISLDYYVTACFLVGNLQMPFNVLANCVGAVRR